MRQTKIKAMTLCALFAALTAVLSQIAIPLAPVPVNLATFAVFLAGGLLGGKLGALSQAVYVLLGAFGLPVFAGMTGGFTRENDIFTLLDAPGFGLDISF